VTVDAAGNVYVSDSNNNRVRAVNMQGTTQTLLGVSIPPGYIQTVIGTGTPGVSGNGGPATLADIAQPRLTTFDPSGNFYVGDIDNFVVRKVTPAGIISTFAGTRTAGHTGDGGLASAAELGVPATVKSDSAGNIYIVDEACLRVVNHSTNIITTILGNYALWSPGVGYAGDGGPAILAGIGPESIAFTGTQGAYYVTDILNNRVREVTPSTNAPR
jgi:serine/threonine-protein kinase